MLDVWRCASKPYNLLLNGALLLLCLCYLTSWKHQGCDVAVGFLAQLQQAVCAEPLVQPPVHLWRTVGLLLCPSRFWLSFLYQQPLPEAVPHGLQPFVLLLLGGAAAAAAAAGQGPQEVQQQ